MQTNTKSMPKMIKYADDIFVPNNPEYIALVKDILDNSEFQSMKQYIQHGTINCLQHSISVSYRSYVYCKKHNLDYTAAARGGLLHDLFLYDWHTHKQQTNERWHGFKHPKKALANANRIFTLNKKEEEIIKKHMWPLTIIPPKYKEAYVVLYYDKIISTKETIQERKAKRKKNKRNM